MSQRSRSVLTWPLPAPGPVQYGMVPNILAAMVEAIVCGYPVRREQGNLGGRGSKGNEETTPKTRGMKSKGNTKEKREHKVLMAGSA